MLVGRVPSRGTRLAFPSECEISEFAVWQLCGLTCAADKLLSPSKQCLSALEPPSLLRDGIRRRRGWRHSIRRGHGRCCGIRGR